MQFLHDISAWLEMILQGISSNFWLSMLFIFLVCVGEAVFIVGLLVPSLPILLLTGGLIAQGSLPFWPIYFAAVIGAIIGDAISYTVGYALKDRIRTVWPFRDHLPLITKGEEFFARHGGKAIFIGRFITGVKAVIPGIAGMMGMSYRHFSVINVVSAFVWAAVHILPGMLLTKLAQVDRAEPRTGDHLRRHHPHRALPRSSTSGSASCSFFAPFLGSFGRSIQARWQKPEAGH